jgi:hypothetical protein
MRYYNSMVAHNGPYWKALEYVKKYPGKAFITRPNWDGIHFITKQGDYAILLKTGEIMVKPENIMDMDKSDWMLVNPTKRAIELIKSKGLM